MTGNVSRRAIIGAAAAAPVLATTMTTPAQAAGRTTLLISPHPDDETLRGAGYVNWATHRGDRMILIAMTDGEGTSMGPREGLTRQQVAYRRIREQEGAWSALTHGTGEVHRIGLPDGGVTYDSARGVMRDIVAQYPGAEVYVAAHPWDTGTSSDHIPIWEACRDSGAAVVRYLKRPDYTGGGTGTHYPVDIRAAQDAVKAYFWTLGPRSSVGVYRNALVNSGFRSRYTR